jgi:hypothetical protein
VHRAPALFDVQYGEYADKYGISRTIQLLVLKIQWEVCFSVARTAFRGQHGQENLDPRRFDVTRVLQAMPADSAPGKDGPSRCSGYTPNRQSSPAPDRISGQIATEVCWV